VRLLSATPEAGQDAQRVDEPDVVVMTVVRDEAHMLPRWVDYYGAQVGLENLIVLDDNSVDGSTHGLGCTVHRLPGLPGGTDFEVARIRLVSGLASGLLASYDVVVFVDADEFLIPDPTHFKGLRDYLAARADRDVIAPVTLNVLHHVATESDIDASRPLLGQRAFAKFVPVMCKPSVKRVPARWRVAAHGIMATFDIDPQLFMLHMKYHDLETVRRVAGHRRRLVDLDGRAAGTTWAIGGDETAASLQRFSSGEDPSAIAEFDPTSEDLTSIVRQMDTGIYRATGIKQARAMQELPLRRVPERLYGIV